MTTATQVPVTTDMSGDELDAEDAWHTVRRHGLAHLAVSSFLRFRYGDGFTNSRALALQMALGVVPFLLAMTGLAAGLDAKQETRVLARTIAALTPGSRENDMLSSALASGKAAEESGEIALVLGLLFAVLSMVTAVGQVERGCNRIYGIPRDRPAPWKYGRAVVMTLVLALPIASGFALLVAGGPFGDAMQDVYGWSDTTDRVWDVVRWPLGLAVTTFTIAVLLDHAPRRRQPGLSWLGLGSAVSVALTMVASALLGIYVQYSASFGSVYGPLAGVMALLIWTYLTSIAFFFGAAMAAQLEALRGRVTEPTTGDPGPTRQTASRGD
ncbi:MAG: YihY/virulence factor BrkB family protein [Actinomycetota bacterium]|nr:YihY/virulence factor BrkB family protein [Actinomycetota bacterium]